MGRGGVHRGKIWSTCVVLLLLAPVWAPVWAPASALVSSQVSAAVWSRFAQDAGSDESRAAQQPPAPVPAPVEVRTRIDAEMFPPSWLVPEIDAQAVQLKPQEEERARRLIARAMAKYPPSVLSEHLDRIYLVDRLAYSGITAAGTNSLDRVYLVVRGPSEGYTDHFVESSFHHEFSSILLREHRHLFDQEAWDACNPEGFAYGNDGVEAVKNGQASTEPRRKYMRRGFMSQYALSSMENDFNLIAEELFMGEPAFWRRLERYERLRRKAELIMDFYRRIDAGFTPARFESFSGQDDAPASAEPAGAADGG